MRNDSREQVAPMLAVTIKKCPAVCAIAFGESIVGTIEYYLPLWILSSFLAAFMTGEAKRFWMWGVVYFAVIFFLKLLKRCMTAARVTQGRRVSEREINAVYEKIHKISYTECVDFEKRQKYMTALDMLLYEFDYSDVIDSMTAIAEGILKVAVSLAMTLSLIMARPMDSMGFKGILSEPLVGGILFALIILVLSMFDYGVLQRRNAMAKELLEQHILCENKIAYLQNNVVYRFGEYLTYHVFGMEKMFDKRLGENEDSNVSFYMRSRKNQMRKNLWVNVSAGIATVFAFMLTISKTLTGAIEPNYFVTYLGAAITLHAAVFGIVDTWGTIRNYVQYFKLLDETMALPEETEEENTGLAFPERVDSIAFEDVTYRYPNAKEDALKNVNFTLDKTQSHVLVGENGSGKTTLLLLLARILIPSGGRICINGVDAREYNLKEYRDHFSYIFQDGGIYPMSIADNVSLNVSCDVTRVEEVLEFCGLRRDLCSEDEVIKDAEHEYSGGENQKMLAARAFYKNADVYVFDEPTSAMDPLSEAQFYNRLKESGAGHFVLYVTHRMACCRDCGDIIVMENGCLRERGTHTHLMDKGGAYRALWEAHATQYKD